MTFNSNIYNKIDEALRMSYAKKYARKKNDINKSALLDHIFSNKNRIYLSSFNFEYEPDEEENPDRWIDKRDIGYKNMHGYLAKIGAEDLDTFMLTLFDNNIEAINFGQGKAVFVGNRNEFKIGKAVSRILGDPELKEIPSLDLRLGLKKYNELRTSGIFSTAEKEAYKIVISRHPYDIAGMSTDRDWVSCMNLGGEACPVGSKKSSDNRGMYHRTVGEEIEAGSIISYLIKDGDDNIKKPVARILLKRYNSLDEEDYPETIISREEYNRRIATYLATDYINTLFDAFNGKYYNKSNINIDDFDTWFNQYERTKITEFVESYFKQFMDDINEYDKLIQDVWNTADRYALQFLSVYNRAYGPAIPTGYRRQLGELWGNDRLADRIIDAAMNIVDMYIDYINENYRDGLREIAYKSAEKKLRSAGRYNIIIKDEIPEQTSDEFYLMAMKTYSATVKSQLLVKYRAELGKWLNDKQSYVNGIFKVAEGVYTGDGEPEEAIVVKGKMENKVS